MGLKHLLQIEDLMKSTGLVYTQTRLRTLLGFNWKTVKQCIDYLIEKKKIRKLRQGYQWKK